MLKRTGPDSASETGWPAPVLDWVYKNSAGLLWNEMEEHLDIETKKLDIAASVGRTNKPNAPVPPRPEPNTLPALTSPMDQPGILKPGDLMVVECGPLSAEVTDAPAPAIELLWKMGFGTQQQEWPSPFFGPVLPRVLEQLKTAHQVLTTRGFVFVGDPLNPLGDGRSWVLRCKSTMELPNDADPTDLAQQYLESAGATVAAKPILDGDTLLIALWESARDSTQPIRRSGHPTVNQSRPAEDGSYAPDVRNTPTHEEVGRKRAADVLRAQEEIAEIRGHMDRDEDYDYLKSKWPSFMLFKVCDRDPDLKSLLLGIKGHHQRRALRFAKQVAAAHNRIKLNTIEKAWDEYNPNKRARHDTDTPRPAKSATASRPKPR